MDIPGISENQESSKNQASGFFLITSYSEDTPKKIMNRNDLFDPPKLPFQGCSKQNNPCLPPVPDYI